MRLMRVNKMKVKTVYALLVAAAAASTMTGGSALAGGLLDLEFGDATFSTPLVLDNPYWPLLPGGVVTRTMTYIGEGEDECTINTIAATLGDMKVLTGGAYAGQVAQVVVDKEWAVDDCATLPTDDDLKEWTFDWIMRDDNLNYWYVGEDSRGFEDGCPSLAAVPLGTPRAAWPSDELFLECTAGSWEAGQPGQEEGEVIGEAGIIVPGDVPDGVEALTAGTFWMQEVAENAEDMAKLLKDNAGVSVDVGDFAGDYESCRKVKEWTLLEPGGSVEHKFYCLGPGLLLINGVGGGPTETEVLVEIATTP